MKGLTQGDSAAKPGILTPELVRLAVSLTAVSLSQARGHTDMPLKTCFFFTVR